MDESFQVPRFASDAPFVYSDFDNDYGRTAEIKAPLSQFKSFGRNFSCVPIHLIDVRRPSYKR